jgi:hypothetical protein
LIATRLTATRLIAKRLITIAARIIPVAARCAPLRVVAILAAVENAIVASASRSAAKLRRGRHCAQENARKNSAQAGEQQ